MIDLNNVYIENLNFNLQGNEEILQNLKILYTTPMGSVAFDREFGIDIGILDNPIPISQGKLIVEYINKTRKYEPRVKIKEVIFIESREKGSIIPKVVIEFDSNIK